METPHPVKTTINTQIVFDKALIELLCCFISPTLVERERIVRQATTVPDRTVRCACVPKEPAATPSRGAPGESALTMATAAPTGHATTSSVSTHATMHAASRHNAR